MPCKGVQSLVSRGKPPHVPGTVPRMQAGPPSTPNRHPFCSPAVLLSLCAHPATATEGERPLEFQSPASGINHLQVGGE